MFYPVDNLVTPPGLFWLYDKFFIMYSLVRTGKKNIRQSSYVFQNTKDTIELYLKGTFLLFRRDLKIFGVVTGERRMTRNDGGSVLFVHKRVTMRTRLSPVRRDLEGHSDISTNR